MKKLLSVFMTIVMVLGLASIAMAANVDLSTMTVEQLKELRDQIDVQLAKLITPTEFLFEGDLGRLHVMVVSAEKAMDFQDNPAISITYYLKNNSSEPAFPLTNVYLALTQNGEALENTVVLGAGDPMAAFNDIDPQASVLLTNSYLLIDESTVTIRVQHLLDFTGTIAPIEGTVEVK